MEKIPEAPILQRISDASDSHALMMGHEAANNGVVFILSQACGREVDRFIKPKTPLRTKRRESFVVLYSRDGIDHGRQPGGIRGYHLIITQPPRFLSQYYGNPPIFY